MARPRRRALRPQVDGLRRALVERRLELGLTQVELADLADVSRASLQRLETGVPSSHSKRSRALPRHWGAELP